MRLWALAVLVLLAGCAEPTAPAGPGTTSSTGTTEPGPAPMTFAPPDVSMYWQGRDDVHELVGRSAQVLDGVATIEVHEEGIEGGDFGITFEVRASEPGNLYHDPGLAADGTFRFDYEEAVFWTGEPICRVLEVSAFSTMELERWDLEAGETSATFEWWFSGDCPDSERGEERSRHITGSW